MENKELLEHLSKVLETEVNTKSNLLRAKEMVEVFEAETFLSFKRENIEGPKKRTEKEIDSEVVIRLADSKESKEYKEAQVHYEEAKALVEVARAMVAFAVKEGVK